MDFEQFKEELAFSVKEIMYSKYGMEVEVEARTMEKMNSSYEALLETVPHKNMEDMAVVYRFEVNTTSSPNIR